MFVLKTVEEDHPIPEDVHENYENKVAELASRGFRALGVARKRGEGHWEILGVMPCMDPLEMTPLKQSMRPETLV